MRSALFGLAILASAAHADNPRELFGLGKEKAKTTEEVTCDDGKTLGCAYATDDLDPVTPYALRTWLPSSYLLKLPVADARADQVAHYATGAGRDEAGVTLGGATGLENRWTINGAPADSPRNGNFDTRVPLTFMDGMLVIAGGFAARDRTSTGGTIDIQLKRGTADHVIDAYVWGGWSSNRTRRPIPLSSFQLRRLFVDGGPEVSASVVATGPLPGFLGGDAWYAAGVAPTLVWTDFDWRAARLVDFDGNGVPDGFPGRIALETIEDTHERTLDYLIPVMARAGWDRGAHAVDVTVIGNAFRDTSMLALATKQAAGIDRIGYVGDAIATWNGTWKSTRARAQFAWHRSVRNERAHDDDAARLPQLLSAYVPVPLAQDPALAAACYDRDPARPIAGEPEDTFPQIPNCPIPFGYFASGGPGLLTDATADRPTITADIAHQIGKHVLRAGATLEDTRLVLESRFSGGYVDRSLFPGHIDRQRFYDGECSSHTIEEPVTYCHYIPSQSLRFRTRYTAAYVEDTYSLTPRIRANAGVRWEMMWVGTQLHLSNEWAPRLGLVWELLDGTSASCPDCTARAWASMGRTFTLLPAGLGLTVIRRNSTVRDVEFGLGPSRTINPGAVFPVADDIEPAAQDEVTAGVELGVLKLVRLQGWVLGRTLRRGFETVVDASGVARFDNPGRRGEATADRDVFQAAAEVVIAPTPRMTFRATYLFTLATGSFAGPFDPRQGANLFNGSDWDSATGNIFGRLPTDVPHRVLFELERRGTLGGVELAASTHLTVASGRPRNVLADGDSGIIFLLQRGSQGRGELVSQANVRVAARWLGTDITLDVFNLFDHRTPTNLDEVFASGDIQPIIGGTPEDLVFAKTEDGSNLRRRTAFRLPFAFQAPIAVVLGVHRAF